MLYNDCLLLVDRLINKYGNATDTLVLLRNESSAKLISELLEKRGLIKQIEVKTIGQHIQSLVNEYNITNDDEVEEGGLKELIIALCTNQKLRMEYLCRYNNSIMIMTEKPISLNELVLITLLGISPVTINLHHHTIV